MALKIRSKLAGYRLSDMETALVNVTVAHSGPPRLLQLNGATSMHAVSRRAILAGTAALAGTAVNAEPDPIFAAIQEHRRAYAARAALLSSDPDPWALLSSAATARATTSGASPVSSSGCRALFPTVVSCRQEPALFR